VKALSLWQPYASLLAAGKKRVETRSWPTSHRGPLLVHAAKKWDMDIAEITRSEPFKLALAEIGIAIPDHGWSKRPADLPFGALVGRVDVVDCVPTEKVLFESIDALLYDMLIRPGGPPRDGTLRLPPHEQPFGDYSPGRFAWLTANPVRFGTPVPYCGGLGLFDVPDELIPEATP
jgi:activating signal cointegrator 1